MVDPDPLEALLRIARALSDESRSRALLALRGGELCLCQVIELLRLAPSTVSKHMSVLREAGLIESRKEGRWHYYRSADPDAPDPVRKAIAWAVAALEGDRRIEEDERRLADLRRREREELSACYRE